MHPGSVDLFFMIKSLYFPHDYNAANDVKCLYLRQQLGMEGYGIFWFLIENLANSGGSLPLKIIPVLAMQMQMPEVKVKAVIMNFELFQLTDNEFFSARLNTHLDLRKTLSDAGKTGAVKRWVNSPPNSPPIGEPYAKKEKKESKEKKEIKIFNPPDKSLVIDFFNEKLDEFTAMAQADLFFNYYEANGWKVGKNKMQNWKAAAAGWISRMNNFKTNDNGKISTADKQSQIRQKMLQRAAAIYAAGDPPTND